MGLRSGQHRIMLAGWTHCFDHELIECRCIMEPLWCDKWLDANNSLLQFTTVSCVWLMLDIRWNWVKKKLILLLYS